MRLLRRPFTRGPERSRTSAKRDAEARELAEKGYTRIQLLGQNVNSYRDPSPAGWISRRSCAVCGYVAGIAGFDLLLQHPRDFVQADHRRDRRESGVCAIMFIFRYSPVRTGVLGRMQRLYTRDEYMRRSIG